MTCFLFSLEALVLYVCGAFVLGVCVGAYWSEVKRRPSKGFVRGAGSHDPRMPPEDKNDQIAHHESIYP